SAQLTTALLAGEFEFAFQNASLALPYVRSGQLQALAVTAPHRLPQAPDIPAITEAKLTVLFDGGIGFLVPRGTPALIVEKIQRDTFAVLRHPAVVDHLAANSQEAVGSSPAEFRARIRSETARWAPIVRASGARPD